jgi:hypothetical protein
MKWFFLHYFTQNKSKPFQLYEMDYIHKPKKEKKNNKKTRINKLRLADTSITTDYDYKLRLPHVCNKTMYKTFIIFFMYCLSILKRLSLPLSTFPVNSQCVSPFQVPSRDVSPTFFD